MSDSTSSEDAILEAKIKAQYLKMKAEEEGTGMWQRLAEAKQSLQARKKKARESWVGYEDGRRGKR